jgi:DNA-binding transcriptional MocR family regulator
MLLARLEEAFGNSTLVEWSRPRGGYFITLRLPCASAKRVYHLAREAGVSLTPVGATHPYGVDPEDAYLRIAPTSLTLEELALACDVLINAIWISILEAFLAEK